MTIFEQGVSRIRAEYLEMPGLRLTSAQVQRLCGIEPKICETALDLLLGAQFLCLSADGCYTRFTNNETAHHRIPKADLRSAPRSLKESI